MHKLDINRRREMARKKKPAGNKHVTRLYICSKCGPVKHHIRECPYCKRVTLRARRKGR